MASPKYKSIVDNSLTFLELIEHFKIHSTEIKVEDVRNYVNDLATIGDQAAKVADGIEPRQYSQWTDYLVAHYDVINHRLQIIYIFAHYKKQPTNSPALNAYLNLVGRIMFSKLRCISLSAVQEVGKNGSEKDVLGYFFTAAQTVLALYGFSLFETELLDEWRDLIKSYWQKRMPEKDMARSLGIEEPSHGFIVQ